MDFKDDFDDSGDDLSAAREHLVNPEGGRKEPAQLGGCIKFKFGELRVVESDRACGVDEDVGDLREMGVVSEWRSGIEAEGGEDFCGGTEVVGRIWKGSAVDEVVVVVFNEAVGKGCLEIFAGELE